MEEIKSGQKTEKARIADEDVVEWIKTLMEDENHPFSAKEIDKMMSGLNFEYGRIKMSPKNREILEKNLKSLEKHRKLTPSEKENLKEYILAAEQRDLKKEKPDAKK